MSMVKIEEGFRIALPEKLRKVFSEGDEILITRNADGHFVLLTLEQFKDPQRILWDVGKIKPIFLKDGDEFRQ